MPAFLVSLPDRTGRVLTGGFDNMTVFASDAADAVEVAKSQFDNDSDSVWGTAVATEIVAGSTELPATEFDLRVAILDSAPVIDVVAVPGTLGVVTVAINAAGTGYTAGDVVTVSNGAFTRAAKVKVLTETAGVPDTIALVDPGEYTTAPAVTGEATTGGTGTALTLDLTTDDDDYINVLAAMVGLLNATTPIADAALDLDPAVLLFTVSSIADAIGDKDAVIEFRRNGVAIPSLVGTVVDKGIAGAVITFAIPAVAARIIPRMLKATKS